MTAYEAFSAGLALVCWHFAAFGAAFVVGHSKISLGIRELFAGNGAFIWLALFLECAACIGFWLGFVAGAAGLVPFPLELHWFWAGLFLAFETSGVNLLLAKKIEMGES